MKVVNVIIVYHPTDDKILMCRRTKDPYKGKFNLVGGKLENGEDHLVCAYRELEEETGITSNEIKLSHLMDFTYYSIDLVLEVYMGTLKFEKELTEELHPLCWIDLNEDFFREDKFAGEGNIGHMLKQAQRYKETQKKGTLHI